MNIPREERDAMPFGEMSDMIACYQIINGMAKLKIEVDDMKMIPDVR